jgi:hypothetical protein
VESKLGPLGTSATHCPIVPAPGDCEDGEFGGMNGRGNRSTQRKPAPTPLCPPQSPLDQTRDWTRAAAVGRIGGLVDPRADLNDLEKIQFLTLPGTDPSVVQPAAIRSIDYATPPPRITAIIRRYSDQGKVWFPRAVSNVSVLRSIQTDCVARPA